MKTPGKITAVIVLLVISLAIDLVAQLGGPEIEVGFLISAAIRIALIFGLLKGSEGVRKLVTVFAYIGVFFAGIALIMLLLAAGKIFVPMAIVAALFGVISNGFVIYALADKGVQAWMFSRSVGGEE